MDEQNPLFPDSAATRLVGELDAIRGGLLAGRVGALDIEGMDDATQFIVLPDFNPTSTQKEREILEQQASLMAERAKDVERNARIANRRSLVNTLASAFSRGLTREQDPGLREAKTQTDRAVQALLGDLSTTRQQAREQQQLARLRGELVAARAEEEGIRGFLDTYAGALNSQSAIKRDERHRQEDTEASQAEVAQRAALNREAVRGLFRDPANPTDVEDVLRLNPDIQAERDAEGNVIRSREEVARRRIELDNAALREDQRQAALTRGSRGSGGSISQSDREDIIEGQIVYNATVPEWVGGIAAAADLLPEEVEQPRNNMFTPFTNERNAWAVQMDKFWDRVDQTTASWDDAVKSARTASATASAAGSLPSQGVYVLSRLPMTTDLSGSTGQMRHRAFRIAVAHQAKLADERAAGVENPQGLAPLVSGILGRLAPEDKATFASALRQAQGYAAGWESQRVRLGQ